MLNTKKNNQRKCMFCSTFCFDFQKELNQKEIFFNDCSEYKDKVQNYSLNSKPMIKGKIVTLEKAIKELRKIVNCSEEIHLEGFSCDQKTTQTALRFAEQKKCSINHMQGKRINKFFSSFQRYGGSILSFNELKNRSDFLIFINISETSICDFFLKKLEWSKQKMEKNFFFFNNSKFGKKKFNGLLLQEKKLVNFLNLTKRSLISEKINHKNENFLNLLSKSKYPVIIYNPDEDDQILTNSLLDFIKFTSKKKRIRLLSLLGANNSAGFINSCITKTGFPNGINFTDNGAEYEPHNIDVSKMSVFKDLQIYISSFESMPKIEYFKKNVFIGNPNLREKVFFDVYIPTTTPGIDSNGLVVRSDGVGIIKLSKIIESQYIEASKIFLDLM
tara:strand:- start:27 stop:1190 length:1164 start_codon:yes stop_codon:yes gene_type:complete